MERRSQKPRTEKLERRLAGSSGKFGTIAGRFLQGKRRSDNARKDLNSTKSRLASSLLSQDRLGDAADRRNVIERVALAETLWILREFNERGRCLLDLGITLQDAPLRATNRPGHAESLTLRSAVRRRRPEARPSFASRVKTPYNG
jgi:hypothetical protein